MRCIPDPIERDDVHFIKEAYAVYYYRYPIKNAIWRLKYNDEPELADVFGVEMAKLVQQFALNPSLIVPVPARKKKIRARGYSAQALLAERIGKELNIPVSNEVLEKIMDTQDQHHLSERERKVNLLGAFEVRDFRTVRGKRILLVDDVFTTGATVDECAKMLLAAGAVRCDVVCFAEAEEKTQFGGV